jgi:hypothetical protein
MPPEVVCSKCGYSTRATSTDRCSECGNDLAGPRGLAVKSKTTWLPLICWIIGVPLILNLVGNGSDYFPGETEADFYIQINNPSFSSIAISIQENDVPSRFHGFDRYTVNGDSVTKLGLFSPQVKPRAVALSVSNSRHDAFLHEILFDLEDNKTSFITHESGVAPANADDVNEISRWLTTLSPGINPVEAKHCAEDISSVITALRRGQDEVRTHWNSHITYENCYIRINPYDQYLNDFWMTVYFGGAIFIAIRIVVYHSRLISRVRKSLLGHF